MTRYSTLIFALATCAIAQNLDELINDVFKNRQAETTTVNSEIRGSESCECVPYYQCRNNTIITDGFGLINIRLNDQCKDYLEICCGTGDITEDPITPPPAPLQEESVCGRRNANGVGFRITGDSDGEAQFGEFPWMVALLREESNLEIYHCGGTLIHPQVVLTAAHCVTNKDRKYKIRAGEWDSQTKNEIYAHQHRYVKTITIHPNFYSGGLFNDVALLFLDKPVEKGEHIAPVCLAPQDTVVSDAACFATGWGKDVFGKGGKYQVILKKIELPSVDRQTCQENLRKTRLGAYFNLHESFVCAGGEEGKDTCKGDGGGPLVCPIPGEKNKYYQAGIVAWGIGCAQKNVPGVYVNVPHFRNWIDEQLKKHDMDTSSYNY